MKLLRSTLSALSLLGSLALARPALADGNNSARQDGARLDLVGQAERWLILAAAGPTVASDPTDHGGTRRDGAATAEREPLHPSTLGAEHKPLFDLKAPSASLVARDWRGSIRLMGDRTLVLDDFRTTASNRMVLARLATDSRLATFVQLGIGQWRIDPAMFPTARSYSEVAAAIGSGFELRISSNVRVASEITYTALYRDLRYASDEVAPRSLDLALAIEGRFW